MSGGLMSGGRMSSGRLSGGLMSAHRTLYLSTSVLKYNFYKVLGIYLSTFLRNTMYLYLHLK